MTLGEYQASLFWMDDTFTYNLQTPFPEMFDKSMLS